MDCTKKEPYISDTNGDPHEPLSLWLVPPRNNKIHAILADAIAHIVPSALAAEAPLPQFEPHVTLTSQIPLTTTRDDFQTWLDGIDLPPDTVVVEFQELAVGDAFHKKLFIRCEQSDSLLSLASACRKHSDIKISEGLYDPHVSLV